MNIFHRYIIREHIAPFFYAFFVIMFVLILKTLLKLMEVVIEKDVDILTMAKLLWYNLAWMIALVVPMSVLVATVMAYGRMAAAGEIVAMKAAGISMLRLSSPIIGLSIIATIFMIWFNNVVLPESNQRTRDIHVSFLLKKPMLSLKNHEGQFYNEMQNITIRVDSLDYVTEEMYGITLFKSNPGKGRNKPPSRTAIRASSGHFEPDRGNNRLTVVLENGEIHQIDETASSRYVRGKFRKFNYNFDFTFDTSGAKAATRNDRSKTSAMMRTEIAAIQDDNDYIQNRIDNLSETSPGGVLRNRRYERDIKNNNKKIAKYLIEIHKKNSIPFAAIIFVLVGAPLGILVRRSGASIGISLSIGFFMIYYLFLIGGEKAGDRMLVDPWLAMWAPNFFLAPVGILLFIYATRR
ncbi:LptF/LptG family permease [Candidatus Latescibacterota bacterium]